MREFFKKTGGRVAIVLAAVLVVIGISSLIWGGRTNLVTGAVRWVTTPLQKGLNLMVDELEDLYAYLYRYDQLEAENAALKAQIAEMEDQVRRSQAANEENARLQDLLQLSQARSDLRFAAAYLVSWNASSWSSSFVINRGSSSGIELHDCVITEQGYLVGEIVEVSANSAVVRTLIDSDTSIGALVDSSGMSAVAEGDFQLMGEGRLKLSYLPDGSELLTGDVVTTSGMGEVYPPDLIIGEVTDVRADGSGYGMYGVITPKAELDALTEVFVITDFAWTESGG